MYRHGGRPNHWQDVEAGLAIEEFEITTRSTHITQGCSLPVMAVNALSLCDAGCKSEKQ